MQKSIRLRRPNRDGAIVPLFAILLPVILVLAAFAVNIASMQLTTTELRIATDVTSHCLLYTSPSPRDQRGSRMPSSA